MGLESRTVVRGVWLGRSNLFWECHRVSPRDQADAKWVSAPFVFLRTQMPWPAGRVELWRIEEKMQEGREEREEMRGRADTGTNLFLLFQHWGKPDGHGAPALGGVSVLIFGLFLLFSLKWQSESRNMSLLKCNVRMPWWDGLFILFFSLGACQIPFTGRVSSFSGFLAEQHWLSRLFFIHIPFAELHNKCAVNCTAFESACYIKQDSLP